MSQVRKDIFGVLKGLQLVASESLKLQESYAKHVWANSSIRSAFEETKSELKNQISSPSYKSLDKLAQESFQRTSMVCEGVKAFTSYIVNAPSKESPPKQEITLAEVDILEEDILNPNRPFEVFGFETTSNADASTPEDRTIQLEVNAFISSKGVATHGVIRTEPIGKIPLPKDVGRIINAEMSSDHLRPKHESPAFTVAADQPVLSPVSKAPPSNVKTIGSTGQPQASPVSKTKLKQSLSDRARERKVPASRLARLMSFGGLAAGLGLGTAAEAARRTLGIEGSSSNVFITPANIERIVNTLCRVRGAALKIGQLMSIQDSNVIDPTLQKAFERVRQAADFMPHWQVESVLKSEFGEDWRSKFTEFEMTPFAAASIGQVHQGRIADGSYVAVKIQYPGVAKGIDSDIENLVSVMNLWNVFPEGLFVDKMVEVAKKELAWEVDYVREAECTRKFRKLLESYPDYYVPKVIDELCTPRIFTSELIEGVPVDKCVDLDEKTRERICTLILHLCLKELFEWRYMQTDPNWSNFFYNTDSGKLILLDFGATRSYDKPFMDKYIEVVKAGADNDREKVLEISKEMGFLTGFESKAMENAHVDTVMILSEQFRADIDRFDFGRQDATLRVTQLVPTILNHRLCPPPEQIYSLHRKLSGVFLLCAKMKVKLHCRSMFMEVYNNYIFG